MEKWFDLACAGYGADSATCLRKIACSLKKRVILRPRILTDPSQAWFWSPRWQQMEREADEDIAAGRIKRFGSMEELSADLDAAKPDFFLREFVSRHALD